tara:strand:+ start:498 stop:635 length:138 start_codon:yes stop_codon:yes gene_type:complete
MTNNDDKKERKRPSRMINVSFPPAKYGLFLAIIIIAICVFLIFFG